MNEEELVRLRLRLATVYEISKCLSRFRSVEETVPELVRLVHETLPIASVVLLEARGGELRMLVWHDAGARPDALLRAEANARSSYAFLAAPLPERTRPIDVARAPVDLGTGASRAHLDGGPDGPHNFMMLPLVIERGAIFGALQVEGALPLGEDDLPFVDAVAQMLSLAIDRRHTSEEAARQAGRLSGRQKRA